MINIPSYFIITKMSYSNPLGKKKMTKMTPKGATKMRVGRSGGTYGNPRRTSSEAYSKTEKKSKGLNLGFENMYTGNFDFDIGLALGRKHRAKKQAAKRK